MDSDRIEGKEKEIEGEAQQQWGKAKDKVREAWDDAKDKGEDVADDLGEGQDEEEARSSTA